MIEFTRAGNVVEAKCVGRYCVPFTFPFTFQCNSEAYAALLRDHLHHALHDALEATRREAYERGWSEARRRGTPKRAWFSNQWKAVWL